MSRTARWSVLLTAGAAASLAAGAPETSVATTGTPCTLEQAYDRVAATDQGLAIARNSIREARLQPRIALTRLGTRVTGDAAYTQPESDISTSAGTVISDSRRAALTVQQPLLDMAVFPGYRQGRLAVEAARLTYRYTARTTLFGVAQAYYDVLRQERIIAVNRQTLDLARQQVNLAERRRDVGVVTRTDVLKARVQEEDALRAVTEAENAEAIAQTVLAHVLNRPGTTFRVEEPPPRGPVTNSLASLAARARDCREDYQAGDLAIQQSLAARRGVLAQYAPTIVAEWSNQWVSPETATQPDGFWEAGVALQIPFFTGGRRELDLQQATLAIESARLRHEQLAKAVDEDVQRAYLNTVTLKRTLAVLRAQVAAAEENYQELQHQYKDGTATSLDVFSALEDLNTARTLLITRTYDHEIALRNLDLAVGTFEDLRIQQMDIP